MMQSFDDATRQVAGLMAAVGGNVDAYEDEKSSAPTAPSAPSIPCFDAAIASVEAHIQHNEPTSSPTLQVARDIVESEPTPEKDAPSVEDIILQMNQKLDVMVDPFAFEPTVEEEATPTPEEEAMLARLTDHLVDGVDCDDMQADGMFWSCMLNDVYLPSVPLAVEPDYEYNGSVYKDGHEELEIIFNAFQVANKTGEPQTVTLDSGVYEMNLQFGGQNWELKDTANERTYCQEAVQNMAGHDGDFHYDLVEETDVFIWVIPDDRSELDDLGYLHNKWVFLRK
jgi:hypothetical protein